MRKTLRTLPILAGSLVLLLAILAPVDAVAGSADDGKPDDERRVIRWVNDNDNGHQPFVWRGKVLGGAFLGVQAMDITPELRTHYGVPEGHGLLIAKVVEGSPAEAAGLQVGDVLTSLDGEALTSHGELLSRLLAKDEGDSVEVEAYRDGRRLTFTATLAKAEGAQLQNLHSLGPGVHFLPRMRFEGFDASDLPKLDPEDFSKLGESLGQYFASPEWSQSLEKLESHRGDLVERLEEMEKRLKEMEKRLESMGGDQI